MPIQSNFEVYFATKISFSLSLWQGPASQWVDVMKKKRAIHEKVINLVQQQRSSDHVAKVMISVDTPICHPCL